MASRVEGLEMARAASTALRVIDAAVRKQVLAQTRAVVGTIWKQEVDEAAKSRMDQLVLAKGTRLNAGASPSLMAAQSGKRLSGGLIPKQDWKAYEFGANRNATSTYQATSSKGKRYSVTRHTRKQLPAFRKGGRVLFASVAESGPRIMSLWAQVTIKAVLDVLGKE